jgi:hypothetical protein
MIRPSLDSRISCRQKCPRSAIFNVGALSHGGDSPVIIGKRKE